MEDPRARAIFEKYRGKPQELAEHLAGLCICDADLVYKVFSLLNRYSRVDVGIRFLTALGKGSIYQMLRAKDGDVLGQFLHNSILDYKTRPDTYGKGIPNLSDDLFASLINGMFLSPIIKDISDQPRKLSDCEIDWYVNYGKTSRHLAVKRTFNRNICWQLPRRGTGFVVFTPDDLTDSERKRLGAKRVNDDYGYDQIGTKETIFAMLHIARQWEIHPVNKDPKGKLEYGDISRPGGINTPDHDTHDNGKAFDMRLIRNDGKTGIGFTYNDRVYSRKRTKAFILMVRNLYPGTKFLFNDTQLNTIDPQTRNFVRYADDHNNHLHVVFPGGK